MARRRGTGAPVAKPSTLQGAVPGSEGRPGSSSRRRSRRSWKPRSRGAGRSLGPGEGGHVPRRGSGRLGKRQDAFRSVAAAAGDGESARLRPWRTHRPDREWSDSKWSKSPSDRSADEDLTAGSRPADDPAADGRTASARPADGRSADDRSADDRTTAGPAMPMLPMTPMAPGGPGLMPYMLNGSNLQLPPAAPPQGSILSQPPAASAIRSSRAPRSHATWMARTGTSRRSPSQVRY